MEETKFDSLRTRCRALCRALGREEKLILEKNQNEGEERTFEMLLSYRRSEHTRCGEWMRDYIDLRSYVEIIDICKSNPEEQRKAYTQMLIFLRNKFLLDGGLARWEYSVNDSAFGKMLLYEGDDKDDKPRK